MNIGFTNSTGWNLGRKGMSIHLCEPLTSTPNIGTNARRSMEVKNNNWRMAISFFLSCVEIKTIKNNDIITKIKCLLKKK